MSDETQSQANGHDDHVKSSKEHARAAATEMRGAAAEMGREFKERAGAFAGEWQEKAKHLHKEVEGYVRENPTKSVLAALGVGFVIGLVFRR